ncbi:unnamed protein product, partial [Prorocentrum cordatum]
LRTRSRACETYDGIESVGDDVNAKAVFQAMLNNPVSTHSDPINKMVKRKFRVLYEIEEIWVSSSQKP